MNTALSQLIVRLKSVKLKLCFIVRKHTTVFEKSVKIFFMKYTLFKGSI